MYTTSLDQLTPGDVLAKTLYNERGDVLLAAGTTLSAAYVDSLRRRGVDAVYVQDGLADDITPVELVSASVRAAVAGNVAHVFASVALAAAEMGGGTADRPRTVEDAVSRLGDRELKVADSDVVGALYDDVERLMNEILESNAATSLESLKSHNAYTFQHSVDVAIISILMGRYARLDRGQLRELALGSLLHDIGKMYIDEAILVKPAALTDSEMAEMRKHPLMGFEIVRRMPVFSILPAHVAYQHHERQDGVGYPRGLSGSNRLDVTDPDRRNPRRMLLIAEIAAVADVYSAVSSDRPYRAAMPLDKVDEILSSMAGKHLNRDIVRLLQRLVPRYPVGGWVEVTAGDYRGWRGVVSAINPSKINRPQVRLLLDDRGEKRADPVTIDLELDATLSIAGLPPGQAPFRDSGSPAA